jgi:mannose-6-phosphate isomerase-like protein (cupin superfamily)
MKMILKRSDAFQTTKNDVDMWIYGGGDGFEQAAVVYQETSVGHSEEFRHNKSAFVFYIIEGAAEWVIEGKTFPVKAIDVVGIGISSRVFRTTDTKHSVK